MGMGGGSKPGQIQSEINVTPLVDIVLVLLIIFLVTLPIMMKQVTLEIPREITDVEQAPTGKTITVLVKADMTIVLNDGDKDISLQATDLAKELRPLLDEKRTEKVVFVDFEDPVSWGDTIGIMDTIRSIASDQRDHNEIKVALKTVDRSSAKAPATP